MDHVNKTLLFALVNDLKILNVTVEAISCKNAAKKEIFSWLFPTKSYDFVKEFIDANNILDAGTEKLFLELIIDRLYVGISLILTLIEEIKPLNSHVNKYLIRPKQLTLGCCFESFWKIIWSLIHEMNDKQTATHTDSITTLDTMMRIHRKTQTDIIPLNKCDSCASAMMCMKSLLKMFENEHLEGPAERRFRPKILDITQFGCMLQTTTYVSKSLETMLVKLSVKQQEIVALKGELDEFKKLDTSKNRQILFLQEQIQIYKAQYEKGCSKISLLSNENEALFNTRTKNETHIKSLENITKNLNNSVVTYKTELEKLRNQSNRTKETFEMIMTHQKHLLKLCSITHQKICVVENELQQLQICLDQFSDTVDGINKTLNEITKIHNGTAVKINNIANESSEHTRKVGENFTQFKNKLKSKFMEICEAEIEKSQQISTIAKFQIKGNPKEDIARQIEENNEKIKILQKENTKLECILSKFNCLRS